MDNVRKRQKAIVNKLEQHIQVQYGYLDVVFAIPPEDMLKLYAEAEKAIPDCGPIATGCPQGLHEYLVFRYAIGGGLDAEELSKRLSLYSLYFNSEYGKLGFCHAKHYLQLAEDNLSTHYIQTEALPDVAAKCGVEFKPPQN